MSQDESQKETPEQRKKRMISLYIVHFCMATFALGYSIVLTGVLPYLRRLTNLSEGRLIELFGWVVAINPIGQMIFSPPLGWLTSRIGSIRLTCIITCLMYVTGNIIYSCLSLVSDGEKGWYRAGVMLFGRLLVGIGTANQAPIRAYIAGATFSHERNLHISLLSLFQTIGFMLGPALQSALTPLGCSENYDSGTFHIDMYTITGWLSAAVGLITLISFMPGIFSEHYVTSSKQSKLSKDTTEENNDEDEEDKPDRFALISLIFAFFVFSFNFILLETIGTPLCMQQLEWEESLAIRNLGIILSVGAVASLLCYVSIPIITKRVDERLVYIVMGLLPMFVVRLTILPIVGLPSPSFINHTQSHEPGDLLRDMLRTVDCDDSADAEPPGCPYDWCLKTPAITLTQFYVHYAVSSLSFPYCVAICQAMFSKVLGSRPQGLWMGVLTAAGSLARICGPIFVSEIYKDFGTYWTFGITATSLGLAIIGTLLTYKKLVPANEMRKISNSTESEDSKL